MEPLPVLFRLLLQALDLALERSDLRILARQLLLLVLDQLPVVLIPLPLGRGHGQLRHLGLGLGHSGLLGDHEVSIGGFLDKVKGLSSANPLCGAAELVLPEGEGLQVPLMRQLRAGNLGVLRALEPATSKPQLDGGIPDHGARARLEVGDHGDIHVGKTFDTAGAGGSHLDLGHRWLLVSDSGTSIGGFPGIVKGLS